MKYVKKIAHLVNSKKTNTGFTFIELLIVMMFITVFSVIYFPSLIAQVGKAREAEAKTNLSSLGQAQQAYFLEKASFADTVDKLNISFQEEYYNFPDPNTANTNKVKHQALAINAANNGTRNYSMGIYYNLGSFSIVLCKSDNISGVAEAPNNHTDPCISGSQVQ